MQNSLLPAVWTHLCVSTMCKQPA